MKSAKQSSDEYKAIKGWGVGLLRVGGCVLFALGSTGLVREGQGEQAHGLNFPAREQAAPEDLRVGTASQAGQNGGQESGGCYGPPQQAAAAHGRDQTQDVARTTSSDTTRGIVIASTQDTVRATPPDTVRSTTKPPTASCGGHGAATAAPPPSPPCRGHSG